MKRRKFMLLLSAAMAAARGLRAQQKAVPVVGQLSVYSPPANLRSPIRQGMSELGFVEGQNVIWDGPRAIMIGSLRWPPISSTARST
jgi:hypothetical protein